MARIVGVDIPNDKRVVISLTYIYGIGLSTSKKILSAVNVSEDTRVKNLTDDELTRIRSEVYSLSYSYCCRNNIVLWRRRPNTNSFRKYIRKDIDRYRLK